MLRPAEEQGSFWFGGSFADATAGKASTSSGEAEQEDLDEQEETRRPSLRTPSGYPLRQAPERRRNLLTCRHERLAVARVGDRLALALEREHDVLERRREDRSRTTSPARRRHSHASVYVRIARRVPSGDTAAPVMSGSGATSLREAAADLLERHAPCPGAAAAGSGRALARVGPGTRVFVST